MSEKVLGYLFLVSGVALIVFSAVSVYLVFTGKSLPYELFSFEGVSIPLSALVSGGENLEGSGVQMPEIELLQKEVINSSSNLIAHMFLMGFLVTVGYRVAMLGTNLVRPIVVKMGDKKLPSVLDPK